MTAALGCLLAALTVVYGATRSPWLGLRLAPPTSAEPDARPHVVAARGPAARVPAGASVVSMAAEGGAPIPLERTDLIDEPDYFDRYADMDAFFRRQTELARVLHAPRVVLELRLDDGSRAAVTIEPAPRRPLSDLPGELWFQLCAGCIGLLVSMWVLVLRPDAIAVRMFALAGAMIMGFTAPAALYSTRELAIDGTHFRALSSTNHLMANMFGIGLVGIFLTFPTPLVRPRALWILPAVFLPWFVLDATRLAPDQSWGSRLPIMLEMLLAIACAIVQWRRARDDARARATLVWFGVCVLTGASLFVFSVVGTTLFGMFPPIPQGYSFGFFLMMHVGLALGLRQTRLFELNELAYAVLFWVVGAVALVALDAGVLFLLDTSHLVSSAIALFAVGLAYVPARSWIWSRAIARKKIDDHMLFRRVLDVVFALAPDVRGRRYADLFEAAFSPLEIVEAGDSEAREVTLRDDGLCMEIPRVGTLPALRLALPWRGRGLFGERHAKLAVVLLELVGYAESARDAFGRGVREERARVARDLHDDVGAALVSALYRDDAESIRAGVQTAMREMRAMINQLAGPRPQLADLLAEARQEALQRLCDARVETEWPLVDVGTASVSATVARNYGSILRELVSNVVRHAGASTVTVEVALRGDLLVTTLADDGKGFEPDAPCEGNGLRNIRRRAKDVGGTVVFERRDRGTLVRLEVPLEAAVSPLDAPRPQVEA